MISGDTGGEVVRLVSAALVADDATLETRATLAAAVARVLTPTPLHLVLALVQLSLDLAVSTRTYLDYLHC